MAAQTGSGMNANSSMLAFATPSVFATTEHFQEWAHHRLNTTLGNTVSSDDASPAGNLAQKGPNTGTDGGSNCTTDIGMITWVMAAVVGASRVEAPAVPAHTDDQAARPSNAPKPYSKFQLAKLKGFSCVRTDALLQPIWQYFRSTKEVDAQRMQLLESMRQWA
jgi:hypothetical protein